MILSNSPNKKNLGSNSPFLPQINKQAGHVLYIMNLIILISW